MSELVSFHSEPLQSALSFEATVNAPVDPEDPSVLRVGLLKDELIASPKTRVHIIGEEDAVTMMREDNEELRAIHVKTGSNILRPGLTKVVFKWVQREKTDRGYMPLWVADGPVNDKLAGSLALAVGRASAKKKEQLLNP